MPITIGSNIYSLNAQRRLADGSNQLSKVFERLSSGQRINRASDDAAGLAISSSLNADVRVFNQGVRNINDGSSLLNIADGAIEQLSSITVRLKELAEQAANGTYGYHQRKSLDAEAQALSKEYLRIIQSTTFNGRKLFDANFGEIRLQAGYGLDGGIQSGLGGSIGTGSFGSLETYQAESTTSTQIALGDINGDGIIDMITSGTGGGQFATVRLGNGDGTFGGSTSYQMLNAHLSLADLNGDGILDMVSAGNGINVRFGNGDGTFGDVTTYSTSSVGGLEVGDLNGDGVQDIIFSTFDGYNSYVNIMYGSGDGSFSAQSSYLVQTSSSASDIRIGDFNGDGVVDVITVNSDVIFAYSNFNILLGNGDGTLSSPTSFSFLAPGLNESHIRDFQIGDVNGDGTLDIVATGYDGAFGAFSPGFAYVMYGNGNGGFTSDTAYQMGTGANSALSLKLGDINGDGILDIVTGGTDAYGGGIVAIRLGNGIGAFGELITYSMNSTSTASVALADLTGNGVLDIATAGRTGASGTAAIRLAETVDGISALLSFDLTSRAGALQALSQFDHAQKSLSAQRGQIGAFQSRLIVAANVLRQSSENYSAASSRIADADIARESSDLVRLNILQRAATAVLGQANLQPQLALRLLGEDFI